MNERIVELLKNTKIEVAAETYYIVSLSDEVWRKMLENPAMSPRMTSPFMILKDQWEVTLVLDESDYRNCQSGLSNAKVEGNFRMLSFDIVLDFGIVGYFSEISRLLAEQNISIVAISAFSRDHLLIKQSDLPLALRTLGNYIGELC